MKHEKRASIPFIYHPLIDRLLPDNQRNTGSLEELRARVLVLSTAVIAVWGPVFGVIYWSEGHGALGAGVMLTALVVGPILYFCLHHRSVALGGAVLALTLYAVTTAFAVSTGGVESPAIKWMALVPTVAYLFDARRTFAFLMTIILLTLAFFGAAPQFGIEFTSVLSTSQTQINSIIGMAALLIAVPMLFMLNSGLQQWLADKVRREEEEKRRVEAELRQAQQEVLIRSQQSVHDLMESSSDGIVAFRDGRILGMNTSLRKMLGQVKADALADTKVVDLVAEDDRLGFRAMLDEIESTRESSYREFCFIRSDGEKFVAEVSGLKGMFDRQEAGFCLLRDVTERKRLQGKMMQIDRMNAVGTLAAGVAHEINNPLAYVHSNTEFLLTMTSKYRKDGSSDSAKSALSNKELAEALEDIREGTGRIRSIVSDLSTFSKPEQQSTRPLDVCDVLRSALKMAETQLRHRAKVVTDFQSVPAIEASEANLAQVFLNLMVNAAQAIPEGAVEENEVAITTSYDDVDARVVVEIRDSGPGIPAHLRGRIFDPFFSTKGQEEGMGLGLFICRNIVRDHGGDISFETTSGVGTTFRVEFNAIEDRAEPSSEFESPVIKDGIIGRALIIDDEAGVCRTVERVLSGSYRTLSVNGGREALEILERDPSFAVIICDLLMPDISGVEVYRHIAKHLPRLEERTIFMTGGTFTESTNEFMTSSDRPILLKPFNIKEFVEIVDSVAQGQGQ